MQIRVCRVGKKAHGKRRPETRRLCTKKKCSWDAILRTASLGRVRKMKDPRRKNKDVEGKENSWWLWWMLFNRVDCVPEAGLA